MTPSPRPEPSEPTKRCGKCGGTKLHSLFHRESGSKDGRTSRCKQCAAEYSRTARARRQASASAKIRRARPTDRWKSDAQRAVARAVDQRELDPARHRPCEAGPEGCCGRHEWHHDSYLRPDWLKVRALCVAHHRSWHLDNEAIMPSLVEMGGRA